MRSLFNIKSLIVFIFCTCTGLAYSQPNLNNQYLIINAYQQYKLHNKALHYIDSIENNFKDKDWLRLAKAKSYYANQKTKEALTLFMALNNNDQRIANLEIAKCLALQNNAEEAVIYLARYLNESDKLSISLIKSDQAFDQINNSTAWIDLWKKDWYSKSELLFADAQYEYRMQNYNEAQNLLDNIIDKRKSMHEAYQLKAHIFVISNDFENALYQITQAAKLKPKMAIYQYEKAKYEWQLKKYSKAAKSINLALSIDSNQVNFYMVQAQINMATKNETLALDGINKVNQIIDDEAIKFVSAELYFEVKDYLNCLKYLNQCIKGSQAKTQYIALRAATYFATEMYSFAENDYSFLLDFDPTNGNIYYQRGICRFKQGKRAQACTDWNKARNYHYIKVDEYLDKYCK